MAHFVTLKKKCKTREKFPPPFEKMGNLETVHKEGVPLNPIPLFQLGPQNLWVDAKGR